ncbi:hypothetical protein C0Q70_18996 [Pomacea canaliculata]|uniref:Glycosyl transferase CAP10 domain-containing protein n=1 Tax=Pomacea canaliculata TaxID=400727 RepID=A0A2T7NI53_POMCA|nr:KDEL motif-containing protein 1-like isoform X2 [Pomacea canaliculata]PVD20835.1 hypothetical protein C0Q70_18996 [Pomacea canaliculata]
MRVNLLLVFSENFFATVCVVCYALLLPFAETAQIDPKRCLVWGPGLKVHVNLPVRYFYIQIVDTSGNNITESIGENPFKVSIHQRDDQERVRMRVDVLDRHDGVYIVRLRSYASSLDTDIHIWYNGQAVGKSPYHLPGTIYQEQCYCPCPSLSFWYEQLECPDHYQQIEDDLSPFSNIDMDVVAQEIVTRFSDQGRHSLCHYKIINNKVYRKTYGTIIDFKIFVDAILLSLVRKVKLADVEFFVNLGDWPLETRHPKDGGVPILSWCGSDSTYDIVLPTYDITEATLEMLGRVSLDMLSVQANTGPTWENKSNVAFWRGRDSCRERLQLVEMSRKHPDMIDAALTNMFFFPKDENKYGQIVKPVSFFDFFKSKYQINIDGTVAAYRFPYLIAGDSVVLKQESEYYEHFYKRLLPWKHYIPFKRDLSDLLQKIKWAQSHDREARQIAINAQEFARENLMPPEVFCYHAKVLEALSQRLKHKPQGTEGFEHIEQPTHSLESQCVCDRSVQDQYFKLQGKDAKQEL